MSPKSKYEKDSCYRTSFEVGVLRALARDGGSYPCAGCGAEAVTAGHGRLATGEVTVLYFCRTCHPAHEKGTRVITDVPSMTVVQTRCTTTAMPIGRIVPVIDLPEWVGKGIWFPPDELPSIKDMPAGWQKEYGR